MKKILTAALIATAISSSGAFADELTSGTISGKVERSVNVTFEQPISITNDLTAIENLKISEERETALRVAKGVIAVVEPNVTAKIALLMRDTQIGMITYAKGHDGEEEYALPYIAAFGDNSNVDMISQDDFDTFKVGDEDYAVTKTAVNRISYSVYALGTPTEPGEYNITTTAAIYTP